VIGLLLLVNPVDWAAGLPLHTKVLLGLAVVFFLTELGLRRFARGSVFYRKWTAGLEAVGAFWTAIILSLVYVLSVGPVSVFMRLFGKDPLDRKLEPESSFWRAHEPNPLGMQAAARHQF
jgi:saxitoxin biosynthesis operon SxtJ-like protein